MNPRRLYRCRHDRQLAGVAAGMAEYLGLDPTLVRVLWVVSIFFGGVTFLLYIILAFVMPLEPAGPIGPNPFASTTFGAEASPSEPAADGAPTTDATQSTPGTTPAAAPGTNWAGSSQSPDHRHEHLRQRRPERHSGRGALVVGTLLVVFGVMALAHTLFPGTVFAVAVGPAFLVVLGVALLAASTRRTANAR